MSLVAFKVLLKDVVNDNLPYDWSLKTVNMGFRISKEKKMFAFVVCATTSFPNSGWRRVLTIHQVQEKKIKCTLKMILTIQWYVYVIHQVRVKNGGAWDPAGFLVPATFCCWSSSNPSHIVFLSHANKQSRQFILMLCIQPPFPPKLFKGLFSSNNNNNRHDHHHEHKDHHQDHQNDQNHNHGHLRC